MWCQMVVVAILLLTRMLARSFVTYMVAKLMSTCTQTCAFDNTCILICKCHTDDGSGNA